MKEDLISFETAKLAKEKGFDVPCVNYWGINYTINETPELNSSFNRHPTNYNDDLHIDQSYSAPTQSLLQKWLREKHHIHIQIGFDDNAWDAAVGDFTIPDFAPDEWVTLDERESYKESLEAYETIFEMALVVALNKI